MTDRRTKRTSYEDFDKLLIQKQRRLNEIHKAERELPLVPLPVPIQRGWRKGFVIRDDVLRRSDAHELRRILPQVQCFIYSNRADFKAKKYHSKQEENIPHEIAMVPEKSWDKLQWPEYFKTKWFSFRTVIKAGAFGTTYLVKGWHFRYPWMFVPEVQAHYATHSKNVDPNLAREKAEIYNFFEKHNGWCRLDKIRYGRHRSNYGDPTKQDFIENIVLRETQKEFEDIFSRPPDD